MRISELTQHYLTLVLTLAVAGACSNDDLTSSREQDVTPTTCVTIQRGTGGAVEDSYVKANALKKNFGGKPHLRVSAKEEAMIRFDLSSIPSSSVIQSSTLKLYVNGESSDGTI